MKKTILSMTLMALSLVSFGAMAQNANNSANPQQKQEQLKGKKQQKAKGNKGDRSDRGAMQMKEQRSNPFEGMNLSESQQNQLNALKEQRKADKQKMAQIRKEGKQVADSVKRADRKAEMMARKQNKKEYLEQVKAIVGPENYVIFLENIVVNNNPGKDGKSFNKNMKKEKSHQHAGKNRMEKRGNKSERQNEVRIPAEKGFKS